MMAMVPIAAMAVVMGMAIMVVVVPLMAFRCEVVRLAYMVGMVRRWLAYVVMPWLAMVPCPDRRMDLIVPTWDGKVE